MTWVEIIRCRLAISSVAGPESLPHEPADTATQKCFHCKAFTLLWSCSVISGLLRWWTSHYVQSTSGTSRHSFPEIVQINCRPSAWYWLDIRMARNTSSIECSGEHIYRQSQNQNMVAYVLSELLEVSATYCHTTARKMWCHRSLTRYWKMAVHFASLPHDRWIQRILMWT